MSCELAQQDAAYVLGALAPTERADYERHLQACDECSSSVRGLAGLPGLLARVPADVLGTSVTAEPVPATLLPGLVAAAERHQRRRTTRTALLAAAAVAVVAAGSAVAVGAAVDGDESPVTSPPLAVETTAPPQEMTPVGDARSRGWVSLTPVAEGTRVDLTCQYDSADGGDHTYTYTLIVYSTDGLTQEIRDFEAGPGEEVRETGTTSIPVERIEKVVVETSYGAVLLLTADRRQ